MGRTYDAACRRWEGLGPYYAMFPTSFADEVVARFTSRGDSVLDPFAGRGTAVFSAAHAGRRAFGIEINPVGWVYGQTKLGPALAPSVKRRFQELGQLSSTYGEEAECLPIFFRKCYSLRVRKFLLAARDYLDWRSSKIDRTAMAFLLVYLHGKKGSSLSNQMRQTKSMSPDYAIRWWDDRGLEAPDIDPVGFMIGRLAWRYARGIPEVAESAVYLGDSQERLSELRGKSKLSRARVSLLLTSPPYYAVTNYHYDQWLRLWLLGGQASARRVPGGSEVRGKFENSVRYRELLHCVFSRSAEYLDANAVVYVRTGAALLTQETTLGVLRDVFGGHKMTVIPQPYSKPTQTSLFGNKEEKSGEVDVLLTPK